MAHQTQQANKTVWLRVKRQEHPEAEPVWEDFELPWRPGMNVIVALMQIQRLPVTRDGKATTPVAWDSNCLEEVCGACSMLINGKARQACSALVDKIGEPGEPITIEPLSKFPLVRDLVVDRNRMFDAYKKVKAWIPIDGTYDLGPGPRMDEEERQYAYRLAQCMSCGVCLEVCPQYNDKASFIGATTINYVRLMNTHPTGARNAHERLEALMGEDGVFECGNAQNCVRGCPREIPLATSIAEIKRDVTWHGLKKFFIKEE